MPLRSRWTDRRAACAHDGDRGSAALEFIAVGLLLLVPIVYLVVALGLVQEGTLGAEAAARHLARSIATARDADDARATADAVLEAVVDEYDLDPATVSMSLSCAPAGSECPAAGATLFVRVRASVALPLAPAVLGIDRLAVIPIEAVSAQRVARGWGSR